MELKDQIGSATQRKFDLLRKRAAQGAATQGQEAQGALQRRLASLGNLKSGAAIKQEQLIGQKVGEAKANAIEGINVAEAGEQAQRARELDQRQFVADQAKVGREFQSSEREASQGFGAEQAKIGREFAAGERVAGQEFGAGQAKLGRDFQQSIQNQNMAFKDKVFTSDNQFKQKQLDMASEEFKLNKQVTAFNAFAQALESDNFDQLKPALDGLGASMGVDTSQFQREEDKGFWGSLFDGVKKVYTPVTELF